MALKPAIGVVQTAGKIVTRPPARITQARTVHKFARRSVGFGAILNDLSVKANGPCNQRRKLGNTVFFSGAHVHVRAPWVSQRPVTSRVHVHHEQGGGSQVFYMHKFAQRTARTPNFNAVAARACRFVKLPQQGRHDMRCLQIEIVAGTVQIGRHDAAIIRAMLSVIAFTQLDSRDLGDRIGFVTRLQRTAEQGFLSHRLGGVSRIDAGTAEK